MNVVVFYGLCVSPTSKYVTYVFLLAFLNPAGYQYLCGWHVGGAYPQGLHLQQYAFPGNLSATLGTSVWF